MQNRERPSDPLPLDRAATSEELERAERTVLARGDGIENLDWLAFMFYSHGRADKALAYYRKLVERAPDSPSYHYYLACVLWQAGDRAGAREHWERVLKLDRAEYARLAALKLAGP